MADSFKLRTVMKALEKKHLFYSLVFHMCNNKKLMVLLVIVTIVKYSLYHNFIVSYLNLGSIISYHD
jgi:uncharacterized membrane protein YwzB